MSEYSMADISSLMRSVGASDKALNSTSRKGNTELDMTDFLQLMIVQLQSQTLDDTMDTSEMMNQMVQMQMITAITNMTETNIMSYASSLVGRRVTIGIVNGNELEERVVDVTGTAMSNGQQIIFGKDEKTGKIESYSLNQIMAVGTLPPLDEEDTATPSTPVNPVQPTEPASPTEPTDPTDPAKPADPVDPAQPDDNTQTPDDSTDKPLDNIDGAGEDAGNGGDSGTGDTVTPTEPVE